MNKQDIVKVKINLKPETIIKATKRAEELGTSVEEFITKLILEELDKEQVFVVD
jgi:hypothetical protein